MKRALFFAVAVALAAGGLYEVISAHRAALAARRALVSELSATLGRARALDAIAQQLRAEKGTARPATAMLEEGLGGARTPAERTALQSALACAGDGGCDDPAALFAPAHAGYVASVGSLWREVDAAEAKAPRASALGLLLVLLGVATAAAAPRAKPRADPAAPPPPAADDGRALEDVLRQRLEALYRARSQLGDSARFAAFGELAAALSHGLKTPLAGIHAAVQLAQLKLGDGSKAKEELDEVVRLTEGLTEQVQRFLRAAGQVGVQRQRVRVGAVLAQLETAYSEEAKRRGVRFTTDAPEPDLEVEVDASLLEMALRNLVENALAAVAGGQAVAVTAQPGAAPARAGLEGAAPAAGLAWLSFAVDDDGPGLPDAARRGDPGVTTRAAGSGLGLTIARRVAERHDGALLLEDRPGGGTRIQLVLPRARAEGASA